MVCTIFGEKDYFLIYFESKTSLSQFSPNKMKQHIVKQHQAYDVIIKLFKDDDLTLVMPCSNFGAGQ